MSKVSFLVCSIDGCTKPVHNKMRGWCHAHYMLWWKHGDPIKRLRAGNGEPTAYLNEVVLAYNGGECLIWPYGKDQKGYAKVSYEGGADRRVQRVVCEAAHGPPPTPEHQAAHSCGKGMSGCVTKRHLSWKTCKENSDDKLLHGTHPKQKGSFGQGRKKRIYSSDGAQT